MTASALKTISTPAKIAKLSPLREAAQKLYDEGLLEVVPQTIIDRYMAQNPDIGDFLSRARADINVCRGK